MFPGCFCSSPLPEGMGQTQKTNFTHSANVTLTLKTAQFLHFHVFCIHGVHTKHQSGSKCYREFLSLLQRGTVRARSLYRLNRKCALCLLRVVSENSGLEVLESHLVGTIRSHINTLFSAHTSLFGQPVR